MTCIIFIICFLASTIGGICGIGGGVIIKPVLDMLDIMSVSSISFLSGLTVLSMAVVSMIRQRGHGLIELRTGSILALGAVIGGIAGNEIFQQLKLFLQEETVGLIQAVALGIVTLLTLVYSMFLRSIFPSYKVQHSGYVVFLGFAMGALSVFLGIGGGPINLAILYFAFSMDTKKAAANSLYIIMFSQISSFVMYCIRQNIPLFYPPYLILMISAGILGGIAGAKINKNISTATTDKLFSCLLTLIIFICIYNAWRFSQAI